MGPVPPLHCSKASKDLCRNALALLGLVSHTQRCDAVHDQDVNEHGQMQATKKAYLQLAVAQKLLHSSLQATALPTAQHKAVSEPEVLRSRDMIQSNGLGMGSSSLHLLSRDRAEHARRPSMAWSRPCSIMTGRTSDSAVLEHCLKAVFLPGLRRAGK